MYMRKAQKVPPLREILLRGEASVAELKLLIGTDEQLYIWFRLCFLTEKARAGVRKLGVILDEARPISARMVVHESPLHTERMLEPGLTYPPEEPSQGGVEADADANKSALKSLANKFAHHLSPVLIG